MKHNFGFPGGLGATRFVEYAAKQDPPVVIDVAAAARLREAWFEAWPEMRGFVVAYASRNDSDYTLAEIVRPGTP